MATASSKRALSMANFTFPASLSLSRAKYESEPFCTPQVSSRVASSHSRKLVLPSSLSNWEEEVKKEAYAEEPAKVRKKKRSAR